MTLVARQSTGVRASARHSRRLRGLGDGLALALLALLAIGLNWQAVFSRDALPASGPGSDLWTTQWGNAAYLKLAVERANAIPLWNPSIMSGRPFAGDPLAAIFYPPMHLVHLLSLRDFFLVILIGHLVLGGIGTYALARWGARLSVGASLLAGIAFMWSTRLIGHYGAGHLTMVMAAVWLPWVALGVVLAIRERAIWAAPAGLAFGLAILAGHPQIAFYHGLMLGSLALGGVVWAVAYEASLGARLLGALRVVGIVGATGLIGALIGAALLLPALSFTDVSLREGGLAVTDRLPVTTLLRGLFVVPLQDRVPQELTFAPGIPILLLAAFALLGRRRWLTAGLWIGVLAAAVLSLGAATPVLPFLAEHVPGFGYFRAPARIWFVATLALAILGGLGFDALFARGRLWPAAQVVVIVALAANLWLLDAPMLHIEPAFPGYNPIRVEEITAQVADGDRVYGVQRNIRQAVVPGLGLQLADGQDPLQSAAYAEFMQFAGGYRYSGYVLAIPPFEIYDPGWPTHIEAQPNARILGLVNVGTVLSNHRLSDPALKPIGKSDDVFIYWNSAVLPRAFLVSQSLGERLTQASIPQFAELAGQGEVAPDPATGQVTLAGTSLDGMAMQVEAHEPGMLIVGTPWFPGWRATIDGRAAPVVKVGGVLQGVAIPAGTHSVTVEYRPTPVRLGLVLTLAGLIAAALWTGALAYQARRT